MREHELHITEMSDWGTSYKLYCCHDTLPRWHQYADLDGTVRVAEECWLQSWWDNLGVELLDITFATQPHFPIAVRPSADFDENGGTIVMEELDKPDPTERQLVSSVIHHGGRGPGS